MKKILFDDNGNIIMPSVIERYKNCRKLNLFANYFAVATSLSLFLILSILYDVEYSPNWLLIVILTQFIAWWVALTFSYTSFSKVYNQAKQIVKPYHILELCSRIISFVVLIIGSAFRVGLNSYISIITMSVALLFLTMSIMFEVIIFVKLKLADNA